MSEGFKYAGVIGGGAWGTALAQVCARAGMSVVLQARETEVVEGIRANRENAVFLPGITADRLVNVMSSLRSGQVSRTTASPSAFRCCSM